MVTWIKAESLPWGQTGCAGHGCGAASVIQFTSVCWVVVSHLACILVSKVDRGTNWMEMKGVINGTTATIFHSCWV